MSKNLRRKDASEKIFIPEKISKEVLFFLLAILIIGSVVRLWNLAGPDMTGDDVLYSFRSIGYFDWVASLNTQTTPVVWFNTPVWWQSLSFHDAPPLVFMIQWLFFQVGGVNLWAARLPFVIAGILSIFFIFLLGHELVNEWVGLIAAGALAILNYAVWISRVGLLDGFVILWIILSLYFSVKAKNRPINYLWWGIFCAAGLLTKYTFLFMGPVFLILLISRRKEIFKEKWFYAGIVSLLILLLPVIIYNVMMFKTRGHFDAAISTMVGEHPKDFNILTREAKANLSGVWGVIKTVAARMSYGTKGVLLVSLLGLIYLTVKGKQKSYYYLIWLGGIWAVIMLTLMGGSGHFSVVLLPFIALTLGIIIRSVWEGAQRFERIGLIAAAIPLVGLEIFFMIQNQLLEKPIIAQAFLNDPNRPITRGYNILDNYVDRFYKEFPDPPKALFQTAPQVFDYEVKQQERRLGDNPSFQKHLLVYDSRMDWMPVVWTFERRRFYNADISLSLPLFLSSIHQGPAFFTDVGFEDVTIIIATALIPADQTVNQEPLRLFSDRLGVTLKPIEEIKNSSGQVIFRVFRSPIDNHLVSLAAGL